MPANAKEVKIRLNSIKNTQKITKAMELVAAAKMRKAVEAATQSRTYHALAWEILERLKNSQHNFSQISSLKRFFEKQNKPKHTTIIALTSNRGLCGAFNSNIIKKVIKEAEIYGKENLSILAIGTKGIASFNSMEFNIEMAKKKDEKALDDKSITEIADYAFVKFREGKTDRVVAVYTNYESAIVQTSTIQQIYPLAEPTKKTETKKTDYINEPNEEEVLSYLMPRIAQVELYQALLESNASEHSARMVAMKNANESAGEMASALLLEFNKARQAAITKEIAEISAGTAAVS